MGYSPRGYEESDTTEQLHFTSSSWAKWQRTMVQRAKKFGPASGGNTNQGHNCASKGMKGARLCSPSFSSITSIWTFSWARITSLPFTVASRGNQPQALSPLLLNPRFVIV